MNNEVNENINFWKDNNNIMVLGSTTYARYKNSPLRKIVSEQLNKMISEGHEIVITDGISDNVMKSNFELF